MKVHQSQTTNRVVPPLAAYSAMDLRTAARTTNRPVTWRDDTPNTDRVDDYQLPTGVPFTQLI
jgi:hypothetical protein